MREVPLEGALPVDEGEPPPLEDGAAAPLDPDTRRNVVEQLAEVLADEYVFPEVGAQLQDELLDRLEQGAYDAVDTAGELAVTLTRELLESSHDKHLAVRRRPPPGQPPPVPDTPANGIRKLEILSGNVGYLAIEGLPPLDVSRSAIDGAFAILQQTEALILDNRDNHGGSPITVAYYASYLLENEPFVITRIHHRADVIIDEISTVNLGRRSYGASRPVFVLTSASTFSGGEALTYDLQALGRGVVIGEVTGGGAHPVRVLPLGELFTVAVPFAQSISPLTGGNWEGSGVQPDVLVSAADALDQAHAAARTQVEALRELRARQGLPPLRPGVLDARQEAPRAAAHPIPVDNGDFSLGLEPWGVANWQGQPFPYRVDDGVLCITLAPLDRVIVGWPVESSSYSVALSRGVPYQLSFQASVSGVLPVIADVTVGHRLPPYTPQVTASIPAAEELLPFSVDFESDVADDQAGFAFHIVAGQGSGTSDVCLDDVALGGP